jgi:hypothetical protein
MVGIVASPTPIVPISELSIKVIRVPVPARYVPSAAAAIHPAVPPPTMTTRSIAPLAVPPCFIASFWSSRPRLRKRNRADPLPGKNEPAALEDRRPRRVGS